MSSPEDPVVLEKIDRYYTARLREHGATPQGVDWNSREAQETRFGQLYKLFDGCHPSARVLDYGCGYGAFVDYIAERSGDVRYAGYDVSSAMVEQARQIHPGYDFFNKREDLNPYDFIVASGIFSVKMDVSGERWQAYIEKTLDDFFSLSTRGFAFNLLTIYSDADRMRPDLYYADPHNIFDLCRTRYSRNVAILHDYGIYEFTVHVRL